MSFSAIEKILEDATGLDSSSIGSNVVQRVIKQRMVIAGIEDVGSYYARLRRDKNELQSLIEDVTVPETWFFRDKAPFELLSERIKAEWLPSSKEGVLRILSLPCASGEEAYSIAMALHDLGFNSNNMRIDAVDISKRALARASEAVYGENSFRGDEGNYQQRFFDKTNDGYRLRESIRSMVKFWHGNLLDDKFLAGAELYDVIFCRNVMIYFSRGLQEKAVKKLYRLLAVNGLLFVGHAEAANLAGDYFSYIKYPGAFAFRKKTDGISNKAQQSQEIVKEAVNARGLVSANDGNIADPRAAGSKRLPRSRKTFPKKVADENVTIVTKKFKKAEPILEKIRQLADEGLLKEASGLCERFLENNAVNAEAYYLFGLIKQAEANDADASNLFRKAVYLNPLHYEALVHLAVLAESQGNLAAAAVYRARASRIVDEKQLKE